MASIRIHGRPEIFPCNLTTSILNVLIQNAFPIETICGAGPCAEGASTQGPLGAGSQPARERETHRLAELAKEGEPSGPDMRLACQTYVRGDVEIEVIHLSHALPVAGSDFNK